MIKENCSLRNLHTFRLSAKTSYFSTFNSKEQLKNLLNNPPLHKDIPIRILGEGSNMVFVEDFNGWILKNNIKGIKITKENENHVYLTIGAGESWHDFVLYTLNNNWFGLENLALIPGTVGAAPIQNIGAYGKEVASFIESVNFMYYKDFKEVVIPHTKAAFEYRNSIFKNKLKDKGLITHVNFKLDKKPKINIEYKPLKEYFTGRNYENIHPKEVAEAVIQIRNSKLPNPSKIPNAGSFFKNPIISKDKYQALVLQDPNLPHYPHGNEVKVPAAYLIEQTGWKGKSWKSVGVHKKQALVLINLGEGKANDLKELIKSIQESVFNKYKIALEPEVQIISSP